MQILLLIFHLTLNKYINSLLKLLKLQNLLKKY